MTNTPERTPAEELIAAAAKLRAVAEAVDMDRCGWFTQEEITDAELKGDCVWSTVTGADAAWIALAGPGLAEPLAALLEGTAAFIEAENRVEPEVMSEVRALAVARVLNGGAW